MLWRHGDVLIAAVESIPEEALEKPHAVLAEGEITGHSHRVAEPGSAVLLEHAGLLYLRVDAPSATVVHQEHRAIELPRGSYRVWRQREYSPQAIRTVLD